MPGCLAKFIKFRICVTSFAFTFAFPMKGNSAEDSSNQRVISRKHTRRRRGSSPPVLVYCFFFSAHIAHYQAVSLRMTIVPACGIGSKLNVLWLQAQGIFSRMSQKSSQTDVPSGYFKDGAKCREFQVARDRSK